MNTQIEEEELQATKYSHLRTLRGGKGPPETPSIDWLKDLNKNAVFSCKDRQNSGMVHILLMVFKHPKTYVLADALGNSPRMAADADFCKRFSFLELIEEGGEATVEEGGELPEEVNDDGVRALRPPDMADDADVEGGQPRDGED